DEDEYEHEETDEPGLQRVIHPGRTETESSSEEIPVMSDRVDPPHVDAEVPGRVPWGHRRHGRRLRGTRADGTPVVRYGRTLHDGHAESDQDGKVGRPIANGVEYAPDEIARKVHQHRIRDSAHRSISP